MATFSKGMIKAPAAFAELNEASSA